MQGHTRIGVSVHHPTSSSIPASLRAPRQQQQGWAQPWDLAGEGRCWGSRRAPVLVEVCATRSSCSVEIRVLRGCSGEADSLLQLPRSTHNFMLEDYVVFMFKSN